MNFPECNRCKHQKPETVVFHRNPSITFGAPDDFIALQPPRSETVCYDCFTDYEVAEMLLGPVAFVVEQLIANAVVKSKPGDALMSSLVYLDAYLNFSQPHRPDNCRASALTAVRALSTIADRTVGYHRCVQCAAIRHESELYLDRNNHDWACVDSKHWKL